MKIFVIYAPENSKALKNGQKINQNMTVPFPGK